MSNKVLWHRVNETVEVDLDNDEGIYEFRPYYYDTPVLREDLSKYLDYYTYTDLAVSLVIARRVESDHYPELCAKRVFWLIKNLCERTDAHDEHVAIELSVDDTLQDIVIPYAKACDFPLDRINWFETKESEILTICKLEAICSDVFKGKDRVLHMDLNHVIGEHPTQRPISMFRRAKLAWREDERMAIFGTLIEARAKHIMTPMRADMWDGREGFKELISEYMGHSIEEEERYWLESELMYNVSGRMLGLHRRLIDDPSFWDEILELERIIQYDEIAFAIYARKHGWQSFDISRLDYCVNWSDGRDSYAPYKECSVIHAHHTDDPDFWRFWLSQHKT